MLGNVARLFNQATEPMIYSGCYKWYEPTLAPRGFRGVVVRGKALNQDAMQLERESLFSNILFGYSLESTTMASEKKQHYLIPLQIYYQNFKNINDLVLPKDILRI